MSLPQAFHMCPAARRTESFFEQFQTQFLLELDDPAASEDLTTFRYLLYRTPNCGISYHELAHHLGREPIDIQDWLAHHNHEPSSEDRRKSIEFIRHRLHPMRK